MGLWGSDNHFSATSTVASLVRQSLRVSDEYAANSSSAAETANKVAAIGRWKKISQSPLDITSDCRRLSSNVGVMTRPSTRGAGSKSNLRSKYPTTPIISMIQTSMMELFTSYTPMMQNMMISG